jgi:HEAT repeat protein
MGVTVTAYCKRCRIAAPEVGDFGFIGSPTLGPAKRGDVTPFGTIYEGLAALRLITPELASFKAFLDEHGKHPLVQLSDADEEGEDAAPPKLKAFRFRASGFVAGFYDLRCGKCDQTFRANADAVRPFEPFTPSPDEIALFVKNAPGTDDDAVYHVGGFPFDDLDALHEFVRAHRNHGLSARLERGVAARPKPTAEPDIAPAEPWKAPQWKPEASENALGPVKPEWLPALADLQHRDPERRASAATDLGRREAAGALGYLVALLMDEDARVRRAAVEAVGALPDDRAIRALGRALFDESADVRKAAEGVLLRRGVSAAEARKRAEAPHGPYEEPQRAKAVRFERASAEVALRHPLYWDVRMKAAEALVFKTKQPWAVELLVLAAVDPKYSIRREAAMGLKQLKDPRAVEALRRLVMGDRDGFVIGDARDSKAFMAAPDAAEMLAQVLPHVDYLFRVTEALRELKDERTVVPMLAALRHPRRAVRQAALEVLAAHAEDARARAALVEALDDPDEGLAELAAKALEPIESSHAEVTAALNRVQKRRVRHGAPGRNDALLRLRKLPLESYVRGLAALLRDREAGTRVPAAQELLTLDHPRGNRALLAAARRGDHEVIAVSYRLLIAVGDAGAEGALVGALENERTYSVDMATHLLRCGNPRLAKKARELMAYNWEKPEPLKEKIVWGSGAKAAWLRS